MPTPFYPFYKGKSLRAGYGNVRMRRMRILQLLSVFLPAVLTVIACQPFSQQNWRDRHKTEGLYPDGSDFYLYFAEPVVAVSAVQNGNQEGASPHDKGVDIVQVDGDADHLPALRWSDQNKLEISFVKGTSVSTVYTLQLKPGTCYLGGGQPLQQTYKVQLKPERLFMSDLTRADGAVLVSATGGISRETLDFSPATPVTYVYRRVRYFPVIGYIATGDIPARAEQPTLGGGLGSRPARILEVLRENGDTEKLTPSDPLPQSVLLRPTQPLVPGASYEIVAIPAPGAGLVGGELGRITLPSELEGYLEVRQKAGRGSTLELSFNHHMAASGLRDLFRRMSVSLGGIPAALTPDGTSFSAEVQGRRVTLRYVEPILTPPENQRHHEGVKEGYAEPDSARGFRMALDAEPVVVEVTLPADLHSLRGVPAKRPMSFRAQSKPALPMLSGSGNNLLPLHGDHTLCLPCVNVASASVRAYRWEAEDAAALLPLIIRSLRDETARRELELARAVHKCRRAFGLSVAETEPDAIDEALDMLRDDEKSQIPLRRAAMAKAVSYPEQPLKITLQGAGNATQHGVAEIDLDHITGGDLRPGLYLLSVTSHPDANATACLPELKLKPHALDATVDYLVQVTDLNAVHEDGQLLVNRLTDGGVPSGVSVQVFRLPEENSKEKNPYLRPAVAVGKPMPIREGRAEFGMPGAGWLQLRCGEDSLLLYSGEKLAEKEDSDSPNADRCSLLCDRPLYRPGDTAHIHGVLRRTGGEDCRLPAQRKARLHFMKPSGELLESREVTLDAFGAFGTDFTLPEGEEDVTGDYTCLLRLGEDDTAGDSPDFRLTLGCQVFRRDAFAIELETDVDPVAPRAFTLSVRACDYNGTPVANARVQLEISSGTELSDAQGRVLSEKDDNIHHFKTEILLDAAGRGNFSGRFGAINEECPFRVEASAANEREEYVKLAAKPLTLSPADCILRYRHDTQRLLVSDARTGKPLARAQEIRVCRMVEEKKEQRRPSGFVYLKQERRQVGESSVTVPANCAEGLSLAGTLPHLESYSDEFYVLRATDPEGRTAEYRIEEHSESPADETAELREGSLVLHTAVPGNVTGHVYVGARGNMRHSLLPLKAGQQEISVPLRADEYGRVEVSLVLPCRDDFGLYTGWTGSTAHAEVARADRTLGVELQVPSSSAPGQQIELTGRVLSLAGQAVAAEVCLFAVDAGMLSVSPYNLPDLTKRFYSGEGSSFHFSKQGASRLTPTAIPFFAVWQGDAVGRGASRSAGESLVDYGLPSEQPRGVISSALGASFAKSGPGALVKSVSKHLVWRADISDFWDDFPLGQQQQYVEPCPAPTPVCLEDAYRAPLHKKAKEAEEDGLSETFPEPRLRTDFTPTAVWQAQLKTDADGRFRAMATLPDTLTTYRVFAVALDVSGKSFGRAESEFTVNMPVMLTAGTPLFMSTGDSLSLPLTLTNNTESEGTWTVAMSSGGEQEVTLVAGETRALFFDFSATAEGEQRLQWTARSPVGADAVEGVFPVRYPAPLLKECHRFVMEPGQGAIDTASLLQEELRAAHRGEVRVGLSTSPLLHFSGCINELVAYPYSCTEQTASALLPWIFHQRLAPFCPDLGMVSAENARAKVRKGITALLSRQAEDGGLSYWSEREKAKFGCPWASAHAGLVLALAAEQGFELPEPAWSALKKYLDKQNFPECDPLSSYAAARACGNEGRAARIIARAKRRELKREAARAENGDVSLSFRGKLVDLEFLAEMDGDAATRHRAFLLWMKSRGQDYRHCSTWENGWTLIALSEYLRREKEPAARVEVSVGGQTVSVESKCHALSFPAKGRTLAEVAPTLGSASAPVYVVVDAKAQPDSTDYPGVTEKGLQVTRVYEVKGEDGVWRPATEFKVGDVVKVTLTCAKIAPDVAYLVLEDYLPACMEAINPDVPGQAAGLEPVMWSSAFDHREYLADRVRGFCTRWIGRDLLNMSYFARVKRAGTSTAPPAAARLMYEPQTYGLSPNTKIITSPRQN